MESVRNHRFCLLAVTALFAAGASSPKLYAAMEPWYLNIGIGHGTPKYPVELQNSISAIKALGVTNVPAVADLGAYLPLAKNYLLGASVNWAQDSYSASQSSMSVTQKGFFASGMRFFGSELGSSLFVRGDIGTVRASISTNLGLEAQSNLGFGATAAGGIGIPVNADARILLQLSYSYRNIEGEHYSLSSFTISGLF